MLTSRKKKRWQGPDRLVDGPGPAGQIKEGIREMLCYLLSFSWSFLPVWAMTWSMVRAARRSVQPVGS